MIMNPDEIREAVEEMRHGQHVTFGPRSRMFHAALAFADSLDDPIWWCFEHKSIAHDPKGVCHLVLFTPRERYECDIATATRPRRIE